MQKIMSTGSRECAGIRTTLRIHADRSIKIECGVPVGQCVPRQVAPPEPRGRLNFGRATDRRLRWSHPCFILL
jgi:hypothetical protein